MAEILCVTCHNPIDLKWYFCPNCGMQLQDKVSTITVSGSQEIMIYLVSFFLTPFGLHWGLKYIKQSDSRVRRIGWISIGLTILSIILALAAFSSAASAYSHLLDGLGKGSYTGF